MATRGRKPKPKELKILAGSRPDRVNANAPEAVSGLPVCPGYLDRSAREEWARQVASLDAMGVLSQTDGSALALYCSVYSRLRKALANVRRNGLTIETGMGGEKANPAVGIVERCETMMAKLLVEFGCTPSSRGRIDKMKANAAPDEFEELLSSKPKRKA